MCMCVCVPATISRWRSLKRPHRRFRTGSRPSSSASSIDLASISIRKWGRDEGKSNIRDAQFVIPVAEHPRKFVVLDSLETFNFSICEKIFREKSERRRGEGGGKAINGYIHRDGKERGKKKWRRIYMAEIAGVDWIFLVKGYGGIDAWRWFN